jgi:Mce-associated membrane protein
MAVDVDTPDAKLTGSASADPIDPAIGHSDGSEAADHEPAEVAEIADYEQEAGAKSAATAKRRWSDVRLALVVGSVVVVAVAGLAGWLGFRAYQSHQAQQQRDLFVQVGRQGALNLTTISYSEVDADVKRILDSSTGTFYDDFQKRSQPFIEVVKQAQARTVGTITEAGLESDDGDQAQVLVGVTVKTSNAGAPEQDPRAWRMRISVQKVGDQAKVSNVEFVS